MSRFFRGGNSSSDDESSSASSSSSEDEQTTTTTTTAAKAAAGQKTAAGAAAGGKFGRSAMADSSSDDDEGPRVVKSQKDKRTEEFVDAVKAAKDHLKDGDWVSIVGDLEKLPKLLTKFQTITPGVPAFYVKLVVDIDDKLTEVVANKEETRKMKPAQAKALNALKQRLRKYTKEADIEKSINEYRANPESFNAAAETALGGASGGAKKKAPAAGKKKADDDDSDSDSDSDSSSSSSSSSDSDSDSDSSDSDDDKKKKKGGAVPSKFAKDPVPSKFAKDAAAPKKEAAAAPAAAVVPSKFAKDAAVPSKFAKKAADSDSSSDSDDNDDDGDDWSDEDSDSDSGAKGKSAAVSGASKWLKKEPKKAAPAAQAKPKVQEKKSAAKNDEEPAPRPAAPAAPAAPKIELTEEGVEGKLQEIIAMRGKKGTDRKDQIAQLQMLLEFTKSPLKQAQILVHLTSAQFDLNSSLHSHMGVDMWRRCYQNIERLLNVVIHNPDVVLNEEGVGERSEAAAAVVDADAGEDAEEQPAVMGNLLSFVERLDEELYKSLQFMESHSLEYAKRLQDSIILLKLIDGVHNYYVGIGNLRAAARTSLRKLEHLYYRPDDLAARAVGSTPSPLAGTEKSAECEQIEKICSEIYKYGDDRVKTRAVLCQVYYHAIHDRFSRGRDLLLMSHLQETVHQADESTIILYNRATAQLGLSAFRNGLIQDAHSGLADVCGGGRTKELLAQGFGQSRYERTAEQERFEKRRMVPYHMHIDLDLLECCHLVSAMLIEVPHMAANSFDSKRKVISKPLRRLFDYFDRQALAGPPESMRETVMIAAKALREGEWKKCVDLVLKLDVWNAVRNRDNVKSMLRTKIQEEGLRTYLFTFAQHYDAMSVSQLCEIFELPHAVVHSILSRMIISGELHASFDQATNSLVMHKIDPSRLQFFALQFADKASVFVESNEKAAEAKFGILSTAPNAGGYKERHSFFFHNAGNTAGNAGQGQAGGNKSQYGNNNSNRQGGGRQNNNNNNNNNNRQGGNNNNNNNRQGGNRRR